VDLSSFRRQHFDGGWGLQGRRGR